MNNPFHDLADQYDLLTKQLRETGDQWASGTLSAGVQPVEPPADTHDTHTKASDKK